MRKKYQMDCNLQYREGKWRLWCGDREIAAAEWEDLKEKTVDFVRKKYPSAVVEVAYYFDMQSIPRWFHQYQTHYFNGKWIVKT